MTGRVVLVSAAVSFVASLVAVPFLFPGHVDYWYAPADSPDVTLVRLQALLLHAAMGPVCALAAWAVTSSLSSLAAAFSSGTMQPRPPYLVTGAVLAAFGAQTWLVAWLGNDPVRAWWELCVQLILLLAVVTGAGVRFALFLRRTPSERPEVEP